MTHSLTAKWAHMGLTELLIQDVWYIMGLFLFLISFVNNWSTNSPYVMCIYCIPIGYCMD